MQSIYIDQNWSERHSGQQEFVEITNDPIPAFETTKRKKLNITYVEAPCGGGKTYALIKFVTERSKAASVEEPARIMIVVPSKRLLRQIQGDLNKAGAVGMIAIHSPKIFSKTKNSRSVQSRVMEYLTHPNRQCGASVLLITHQSFMKLPFIPNIDEWSIFIDEVPQIDFFKETKLPISRGLFNKYLKGGECFGSLIELVEREGATLKALLDSNDSGIEPFRELFSKVRSENFGVYVKIAEYDEIFNNPDVDVEKQFKIDFLTLANPGLFQNCCFLAADFRKSLIYNRLIQCGVTPRSNEQLAKNLQYRAYSEAMGRRTCIYYCLEERQYSLTIRPYLTANGGTVKDEIDAEIAKFVGERPFLLFNNADDDGILASLKNAVTIENIPSGLNCYADHTTLVFNAALNRSPGHLNMLKAVGLDRDSINHSLLIDRAHQTSMRTNLRVPESEKCVTIVVMDLYTAKALAAIIGCTDIRRLGNISLPEKDAADSLPNYTDAERKKRSGFLKLMREVTQSNSYESGLQENALLREQFSLKNRACTLESANSLPYEPTIQYTLFTKPDAYKKSAFRTKSCGVAAFVSFLEQAATTLQEVKDDAWLFSMAVYQEFTKDSGFRSSNNFLYSTALVLDFDSGDAKPEQVEEVIWPTDNTKKRERCSYVICNSYSNSPEKPNRFRVIIPFKTPVRSERLHKFIHQVSVDKLAEAGLPPSTSGLDHTSKSPVQSYRLPCTNRKYPDHAFFRYKGMTARTFMSHGLDPKRWERVMPAEMDGIHSSHGSQRPALECIADKSPAVLAEVDRQSAAILAMEESRRQPIYDVALFMRQHHWSFEDIKARLDAVAGRDRNRRRHVKSAMDFLRRGEKYLISKSNTADELTLYNNSY